MNQAKRNLRNETDFSTAPLECRLLHERVYQLANPDLSSSLDDITSPKRRMLEHDLLQAARIQQALLPRPTCSFRGYQIGYHYAPAGVVSGDYCDVIECDGSLLFLFGDVAGKGLAASLLMSHLHGTFRSLAATNASLDQMVELANRVFSESTHCGHFATLVVGRARRNGVFELISAGHPPFLHLGKDGVTHQEATAYPFGMFINTRFPVHHFCLAPHDTLLLYTDGITEYRNAADQEYGFARLKDTAIKYHAAAPPELIAGCLSDLSAFAMGSAQIDDLTLLVIRRTE
jgi:sigma-B regulation protein RsbU (phosphoserine phosphatase)